jgi:hypothetical protein
MYPLEWSMMVLYSHTKGYRRVRYIGYYTSHIEDYHSVCYIGYYTSLIQGYHTGQYTGYYMSQMQGYHFGHYIRYSTIQIKAIFPAIIYTSIRDIYSAIILAIMYANIRSYRGISLWLLCILLYVMKTTLRDLSIWSLYRVIEMSRNLFLTRSGCQKINYIEIGKQKECYMKCWKCPERNKF